MIKEQNSSASNLEEKQRDLLDLQKRADVLIKLIDQERINVLEAPTQSGLSTGVLPISDLRKRLSSNQASIRLAVVVVPVEGPQIDEGKPDVLSLVQEIDKTLRNAGINRRVFECFDDRGALELDSADLGAHAPPGP
ncbi:MAG: hypothetical protein P4N59_01395 [Negativicutes bacterium]|nr:hypothetical protein [Negativicutes bacterium]